MRITQVSDTVWVCFDKAWNIGAYSANQRSLMFLGELIQVDTSLPLEMELFRKIIFFKMPDELLPSLFKNGAEALTPKLTESLGSKWKRKDSPENLYESVLVLIP